MQTNKHTPASTAQAARFTRHARPINLALAPALTPVLTLGLTFGLASSGCQVAKQTLRADFTDFNTIIHRSQNEQMLLNLVRMRFRERRSSCKPDRSRRPTRTPSQPAQTPPRSKAINHSSGDGHVHLLVETDDRVHTR